MSLRRERDRVSYKVRNEKERDKEWVTEKKRKRILKSIKIQTKCFIVILHISRTIQQWKTGSYSLQKHFQRRWRRKIRVHHMQKSSGKPSLAYTD